MPGDLPGVVLEAQAANDETLTDTCTVTRDGKPTWDPTTGTTPGTATTILPKDPLVPTRCRVRTPSRLASKDEAGEHLWLMQDSILRLSASEPDVDKVQIGDTVTITSTPQGVGLDRVYTVTAIIEGSHMSSARFSIRRAV